MKFSKNLLAFLSSGILLGACGNSTDKPAASNDSATTPATATAPAAGATSAADDKAIQLIGSSDCTTCHRLHKAETSGSAIGPAYDDVAAKYSPAPDTTIDRLVKKIISGGSGIWGTVPMTPHALLKPDDAKTMVTYILSLKK
ncbi:MAG TPA: c-type cytochrome [Puia sp.]|jgi:cytochrome c|nr:c-type cytochrome [Puia sp.]